MGVGVVGEDGFGLNGVVAEVSVIALLAFTTRRIRCGIAAKCGEPLSVLTKE